MIFKFLTMDLSSITLYPIYFPSLLEDYSIPIFSSNLYDLLLYLHLHPITFFPPSLETKVEAIRRELPKTPHPKPSVSLHLYSFVCVCAFLQVPIGIHSWDKPNLVMMHHPFYIWIWSANILFRIFPSLFMREIGLWLFLYILPLLNIGFDAHSDLCVCVLPQGL